MSLTSKDNENHFVNPDSKVKETVEDGSGSDSDFGEDHVHEELTPKEWRWVKFKCYSFYMIMGAAYAIQYLDKSFVAAGSVMGLRKDLKMHGSMFSWVNSSYFVGYLVGFIIFSLPFLEKLGPRWNGFCLLAWGVVTAAGAGSQNYAGFIAVRTLLGLLESFTEPTITVMTSQWTHPDDQFSWVITWFAWNGFAQIFLQALGFGIYKHQLHHDYSIPGWRILMIILGLITIIFAICYILFVPNSPMDATFLSSREKAAMRRNGFFNDNRKFKSKKIEWNQVREALTTDIHHSFLFFLFIICNSLNGGAINTYINLILKTFIIDEDHNLTSTQSSLKSLKYGMIPGGIKMGVCIIISIISLHGVFHRQRFVYILGFMALHVASACMIVWGKDPNTNLAGTYMYNTSVEIPHAGIISLIASNAQGDTKRIVVNACMLIGFSVGNIAGPQIFTGSVPKKPSGRRAIAILACISFGAAITLLLSYLIENHIRNRKNEKLEEGKDPRLLTDRENPEFRYHI